MGFMVYNHLGDPMYQGSAATIAYYMFLSILPALILASQAMGLFSLSADTLIKWAEENVSGSGLEMIESLFSHKPSTANSIVLVVIVMWAASRANIYLVRLTNYTFFDGEIIGAGYIRDRLRSLVTVMVTIATVTASMVILVYVPVIFNTIFKGSDMGEAISTVWLAIRWLVVLALYMLVISLVFYTLPSKRLKFAEIIPGSIFTSIGFIIVSLVFNIYVSMSTNYDLLYGSFANAVAIIIWFWIMGWVIVLGLIFNRVWWAVRKENRIPIPDEVIAKRTPMGIF